MTVITPIAGVAALVWSLGLAGGCDAFGSEKKAGGGKEPAAKSAADKPAAADDSQGAAPTRFGDRLFQVGQTAELAGLNVSLKELKDCTYENDNSQKALERSGHRLVGARVEFEATGEQPVNATREFRAHDGDRVVFRTASLHNSDCAPDLKHTHLKTGEKAKGWIGFKIPKDASGLTMRYEHRPPKKPGEKGTPAKQYPEFTLES